MVCSTKHFSTKYLIYGKYVFGYKYYWQVDWSLPLPIRDSLISFTPPLPIRRFLIYFTPLDLSAHFPEIMMTPVKHLLKFDHSSCLSYHNLPALLVLIYDTKHISSQMVCQPAVLNDGTLESFTGKRSIKVGVNGAAHTFHHYQVDTLFLDLLC